MQTVQEMDTSDPSEIPLLNNIVTNDDPEKQPLSTVNELRRNKAKHVVLTILQDGETPGVEEIILNCPNRQYSMQVASENCLYLFLSVKNFKEKFYE